MKKITAFLLVLVMMLGIVACTPAEKPETPETPASTAMTHAEFLAAENDAAVEIEAYVQATQSWWDNKIVIYAQDKTGGYLAYNVACTEDEAAKLVPGTKVNIKGYKTFYKGMPEVAEGATLTIIEGADTYVATAEDMTALLGKQELINKAGMLAAFKGLTVAGIEYQGGNPGKDIYVTLTLGEATFQFCVESYLTSSSTDLYKAVEALQEGDLVDIEGFVYWYDADAVDGVISENAAKINTHITGLTVHVAG